MLPCVISKWIYEPKFLTLPYLFSFLYYFTYFLYRITLRINLFTLLYVSSSFYIILCVKTPHITLRIYLSTLLYTYKFIALLFISNIIVCTFIKSLLYMFPFRNYFRCLPLIHFYEFPLHYSTCINFQNYSTKLSSHITLHIQTFHITLCNSSFLYFVKRGRYLLLRRTCSTSQ